MLRIILPSKKIDPRVDSILRSPTRPDPRLAGTPIYEKIVLE